MQDKLIARILIVWLQLDGYAVVVETASAALKLPPPSARRTCARSGATSGAELSRAARESARWESWRHPLVFPKLKSGAQRR